jgi:hypothetical protein
MTNQQPSPCADAVDASITSMVHAGGHRRPVKIVEHPAFRRWRQPAERGDVAGRDEAPLLAMAFRVVSLN